MSVKLLPGRSSMKFSATGISPKKKTVRIDREMSPMDISSPKETLKSKLLTPADFTSQTKPEKSKLDSSQLMSPADLKPFDITLYFNDKIEVMKILDSGQSILKYLFRENSICPLIGSKINIDTVLGEGKNGIVFDVVLAGQSSPSKFVAKSAKEMFDSVDITTPEGIGEMEEIVRVYEIPKFLLFTFNGIPYDEVMKKKGHLRIFDVQALRKALPTGKIIIPLFFTTCLPDNQYVCEDRYSEYLLSLLTATFKRSGKSVNFVDTFLFAMCGKGEETRQYTFMEKIKSNFADIANLRFESSFSGYKGSHFPYPDVADSLFIQVLHAIATYQTLKINHNDLHQDNILIDFVTADTEFNGQKLEQADFYEYVVGDKSLYIPGGKFLAGKYIVKIADWGYGCKHSTPEVCNKDVFRGLYNNTRYARPTSFSVNYDMLFISTTFANMNWSNTFITHAVSAMFGEVFTTQKALERNIRRYLDFEGKKSSGRPILEEIGKLKIGPIDILTNDSLMKKYMVKPPAGSKIAVLGTL